MRTQVEFRSSKFPPYPGEEEQINPNLWGKRLAEYLHTRLREHGIKTGETIAEDWGWMVSLCERPISMWVGCGHYQEHDDAYLVFIEPSTPTVRVGFFKKIDTTSVVAKVADAIDAILASDPEIRNIRWWSENER